MSEFWHPTSMPFGAGTVAARQEGATLFVDLRPYATGSIAVTYARWPGIGPVLPAMGYSAAQVEERRQTIAACPCDVIVTGTPIDLGRVLQIDRPIRRTSYNLAEIGSPTLAEVLAPHISAWLDNPRLLPPSPRPQPWSASSMTKILRSPARRPDVRGRARWRAAA